MDKMYVEKFLKEQRRKIDEESQRESERRKSSRSREEYEEPSNTIMLRGLPADVTEDDVKLSLDDMRANYIAVRLIKDRRTGVNKVVAFIEFIAVNDAKDLMEDTRGELCVSGYYAKLTYGYNVKEEVDRYDSEKSNSWRYEKPTNTVMLRGVSNILTDNEVKSYVSDVSKHVSDVRLIRDKKTGMSRGFGFVEFDSIAEAQRWMEYQQGYFVIDDCEMKLSFTSTRQGGAQIAEFFSADSGDWSCARCGGHNFKRRDFCYKCHLSKSQSKSVMETIDGKDQIGSSPCNTLLFRDLDALTLEDSIIKSLKTQFNCNVKQCEIMRDDVTKVSRCYAFVELSSLSEARRIIEYYEDHPDKVFELSGKAISINYAKNSYNTLMTSYREAVAKRFEDTYEPLPHETSNYDANAAAAVAQAALNHKKMHKRGVGVGVGSSTVLPANVIVEGRASDSGLCFELIVNGQRCTSVPTQPFIMTEISSTKFSTPDTSKFLYDQSTQYYFDPVTGLYYDSNSQYFFDRMSQKYIYWDPTKKSYIPVETPSTSAVTVDQDKAVSKDGKKSKASEAKKIAKEMEKWEKMMNSKKDVSQINQTAKIHNVSEQNSREPTADSGFSMFSDNPTLSHYRSVALEVKGSFKGADELVAAYNSNSDEDDPIITEVHSPPNRSHSPKCLKDEEEKLINWDKIACLLCNRGFKDRATLEKHRSVSDLHKNNLQQLKEKLGLGENSNDNASNNCRNSSKMKYRDRAKERREKFGVPSPPSSKKRYEDAEMKVHGNDEVNITYGTAPSLESGDGGENIGSKLMAKMGWQHGQGLGKMNQGRTELVQAEFVARGAGIGAAPRLTSNPSDNYRENLKRAMYAKYHDV